MRLLRYLPRFQSAYRSFETLARRESWSRSEIQTFQLERLNQVWSHAAEHVPYYRRLRQKNQLPLRFSSLDEYQQQVPVLPKSAVKTNCQDFLSARAEQGAWKHTGGSTGTPMTTFWAKKAHLEAQRGKYRFYQSWGVDIFDRVAFLWGHSASFAPGLPGRIARMRQPMEDYLRNRIRLSVYDLGPTDLRSHLHRIERFRPAALYGYSTAAYFLAREAQESGFHCDSLKLVNVTAEPASPRIVQTVEQAFGVPAVVEYGSVECGFVAGEAPDRTLRVREDIALLETLPREDGRYDIVISILTNPSFPLLRYAIEDVTESPLELPPTGFAILKNVAGRDNDVVITHTGRLLHSARFDALFKYYDKTIQRFRVQQRSDGRLEVALEVNGGAGSLDTLYLQRTVENLVGYPANVNLVDRIPQTIGGKHRLVVSDLAQQKLGQSDPRGGDGAALRIKSEPAAARLQVCCRIDAAVSDPSRGPQAALTKAGQLRHLIERPELSFLMGAHDGLSAKIAEEAGFEGLWGSGFSIAAALGVRDSNEASWTQVLEVLEFMSDATQIPILMDADTGYGNFNNVRRLVNKVEQRAIAGICIEDKIFPKTNSFLNGTAQPLADIDEFCGKIKAGKDTQQDDDFVIVARVEALIAGWGMEEALKRAEAYRQAGADAILIHSSKRTAQEVIEFKKAWGDRAPVILVPTKYYATPTSVFREHGFSTLIWANHLVRSCVTAMQSTARQIYQDQRLVETEDAVSSMGEIFRLQCTDELTEAEKQYLPQDPPASPTDTCVPTSNVRG